MHGVTSHSAPVGAAGGLREIKDLPSPRSWPVVGSLPLIEQARMHQQFESWVDEFGPLYRVKLVRREVLVVARPDLIAALLRDRPEGWRRMAVIASAIREMGSHGVFSAEGKDWKRQRKLVMAAFDPGHLKRYFPSLKQVTERLLRRFAEAADRQEMLQLPEQLMRYTVDVTAGLAFGIDVNTIEEPHTPLQQHLNHIFPMLMRRINMPFPYWRYVRLPIDRKFDRQLAKVHQAVRGFIVDARARIAANPELRENPTNLLEAMLAASDDTDGVLTENEVVGNVLTILLAGEDTTAHTLTWALYLLHKNPQVWRELVAEVDAALADTPVPNSFEAARGLPYIEACVNEAMRLRPVAPMLFMENNRETVLGELRVPADTLVFCVMRKASVDAATVGDAAEFRPSRWREAAATDEAERGLLKASMPFGSGPRLCPGRYLAMLEMKMVLAMIARNFELPSVATASGDPPQECLAFTMGPVGLRMQLKPRAR